MGSGREKGRRVRGKSGKWEKKRAGSEGEEREAGEKRTGSGGKIGGKWEKKGREVGVQRRRKSFIN